MNKELRISMHLEHKNTGIHQEQQYVGKRSGRNLLYSTAFGICEIMTDEEINEQIEGNECFAICDLVPGSKYLFYVDEETCDYFASLR